MNREIDPNSPEVEEFLQLLAELLAERFMQEQKESVEVIPDSNPDPPAAP